MEVEADEQQGEHHAGHTVVDQLLAPYLVDDEHGDDGSHHVDDTHQHLAEQSVAARQTGLLEDRGAVVEHGIHTHELTQDGNGGTYQHGLEDTRLQQELPVGFGFGLHHGLGVLQLCVHLCLGEVYLAENADGTVVTSFQDEPAGTLGDEEDDAEEEDGRKAAEAEHTAPHFGDKHQVHPFHLERRTALREVEQLEVGEVSAQEADGDGKLVERNQAPTVLRDGNLGNVERGDDGNHPDADAAQDACHHQLLERADKGTGDAGH